MEDRQISLRDIINIKEWQDIQDRFSSVTEVGLRTVDDEGVLVTTPSGQPRLCSKLVKDSPYRDIVCGKCLPTFLGGKHTVNRNLEFSCLPGLHNFVAPLAIDNGKVLGYLIVGPVFLVIHEPHDQYRQVAEDLKIDLEALWDSLLEIKPRSFQGAKSLVELIRGVGEFTLKHAYQNLISQKEVAMQLSSAQLKRVLDALLDVAFQVSGADIGSVMFFKERNDILTIQSSKGIPLDIARNTRVRLGDGISGIAAKEDSAFLIDDSLTDNRIKSRLNRPKLKSAMVLPIKAQNRVVGVMNLGVLRSSDLEFDQKNVRLMNRLIDLATVAITPTK